jgi:hypothetical protein
VECRLNFVPREGRLKEHEAANIDVRSARLPRTPPLLAAGSSHFLWLFDIALAESGFKHCYIAIVHQVHTYSEYMALGISGRTAVSFETKTADSMATGVHLTT